MNSRIITKVIGNKRIMITIMTTTIITVLIMVMIMIMTTTIITILVMIMIMIIIITTTTIVFVNHHT